MNKYNAHRFIWIGMEIHNIAYYTLFIAYADLYAKSELLPMINFDSLKEKLIELLRRARDVDMENDKDWLKNIWENK